LVVNEDKTTALLARDEFARYDFSDHLTLLRAFYEYVKNGTRQRQFCQVKFLSMNAMRMISGIRFVDRSRFENLFAISAGRNYCMNCAS
jgi:hypothetical protein